MKPNQTKPNQTKPNQTKHKLGTALTTTLSAFLLATTAKAQNHYDWTISDDVAHWGSDFQGQSWAGPNAAGSYTRDAVHWDPSFEQFGSRSQKLGPAGLDEGPYDGRAGIIRGWQVRGIMTRTDPDAIFDLSAIGSSATIRTAFHVLPMLPDTGGGAHLYQFGLSNNEGYFGKAGNEALIVGADFQGFNGVDTVTLDLDLLDQTGLDTTGDGVWNPNPLQEVSSGLTVKALRSFNPFQNQAGKSQAIELTYTNIGAGKLKVDVGVTDLYISGCKEGDVVTSRNQVVQKSFTVDHSFSDLSNLRPGFGLALNDSDNPISGATFDWDAAYAVPEPSSASLLGLGIAGFLLRRKRK